MNINSNVKKYGYLAWGGANFLLAYKHVPTEFQEWALVTFFTAVGLYLCNKSKQY